MYYITGLDYLADANERSEGLMLPSAAYFTFCMDVAIVFCNLNHSLLYFISPSYLGESMLFYSFVEIHIE